VFFWFLDDSKSFGLPFAPEWLSLFCPPGQEWRSSRNENGGERFFR
jgi:hypothetical protein